MIVRAFNFLFFILFSVAAQAQGLTGTWEGTVDGREYIQINILQRGDSMCGYTYDYTQKDNYCKAHFKAAYNKQKKMWRTTETGFLENSGSHILMELLFNVHNKEGDETLKGVSIGLAGGPYAERYASGIFAKKTAHHPAMMTAHMQDFMPGYIHPEPGNQITKKGKGRFFLKPVRNRQITD